MPRLSQVSKEGGQYLDPHARLDVNSDGLALTVCLAKRDAR